MANAFLMLYVAIEIIFPVPRKMCGLLNAMAITEVWRRENEDQISSTIFVANVCLPDRLVRIESR